ncbi:hemerythrin domain-containing protein [Rhizomonospora bruguierae]|uniref:hemerythrin domain-containing protein n=1 Tax=Rhizomonospora bruguierae TaxID=1581705 RepID=UPI001BCAF8A5|nr:hemerythrin domain-containing protein [Micromonospora sp. NBRC 107566]
MATRHPMMAPDPAVAPGPAPTHPTAARWHRAALVPTIDSFERALVEPGPPEALPGRLTTAVHALRSSFADHVGATEGPDGLYAELLDQAPRLAPGVTVLVRDHARVAAAIDALAGRLDAPDTDPDELRRRSGRLLRWLCRHRQRGADLVYEAYDTDLGGET